MTRSIFVFTSVTVALVAITTAAGLLSSKPADNVAEGVRLLLNTETLEPNTTFELRFEEPVVDRDQVGMPTTNSPLRIAPEIPGQFVWQSRRSGVFNPSAPPELATTYRFELQAGLRGLDGQPLKARLEHRLETPDFQIEDYKHRVNSSNLPVTPVVLLQFNDRIAPEEVADHLIFYSHAGDRIPAKVTPASENDSYRWWLYVEHDRQVPWRDRFAESLSGRVNAQLRPLQPAIREADGEIIYPHAVLVEPARPLNVGTGWKLLVAKGLPNLEGNLRTVREREIVLGDVQAFKLLDIQTRNVLNQGREIRVQFNKSLSTNLITEAARQWVTLDPWPKDYRLEVAGNWLTIGGDFELAPQRYEIALKPGLPAEEAFVLHQSHRQNLQFAPLPPRVYLTAFSEDQLAGGNRRFELLAVNLRHVRLKAKVFEDQNLIHALRGYGSYFKRNRWGWYEYGDERYKEIDYNLVPGKTVADFTLPTAADRDAPYRTNLTWDRILDGRKHGTVFVQAEGQTMIGERPVAGAQAMVQLTDLGMIWKEAGSELWVLVFSYASGQPVAGATVKLLSDENEELAQHTTDGQGLVKLARGEKGMWLVVTKADDVHAMSLRENYQLNIPPYRFGIPYEEWRPASDQWPEAQIFSDRPVYRPGEDLHLKVIARQWRQDHWIVPQDCRPLLLLLDSRGHEILRTNLALSATGSLDFTRRLPEAPLGQYSLRLFWPGMSEDDWHAPGHSFLVLEFQPNAYEVKLRNQATYGPAEAVQVPVSARYYLGKPLTRAKAHWTMNWSAVPFAPEGFGDFAFPQGYCTPCGDQGQAGMSLTGDLDLNGQEALLAVPAPGLFTNAPQPMSGQLLVEVTDINQQTISASAEWIKHSSDFYLGIKRLKETAQLNEPQTLEVVAVQPDGQPHPVQVPVQARLSKISYRTVAKEGAGKTIYYDTETELEPVREWQTQTLPAKRYGVKWDTDPGQASPASQYQVATPGDYLLEVTAKDGSGNLARTETRFSAYGEGPAAWNYRNPVQIELVPDKSRYLMGELATILVKAPYSGPALVTVERDTVLRTFVVELTGNASAIEVPLETSDAPNVFVSVMVLRGYEKTPKMVKMPEFRIGYCQVVVDRPESRLNVTVLTSSSSYQPEEPVTIEAVVKDHQERPVPGAEVTLYAVDEGILSLTGYAVPDPWPLFNRSRPLLVQTHFSLPALLPEDPLATTFHNKGYLVGGGGETGSRVRKDFLPCAFWAASLETDAEGKVRGTFKAPDSLTRYRVIAVAHNPRNQFGGAAGAFEINKPLMIESSLPLFVSVGDTLEARAVVHNLTDQAGEIEVSLELDDKAATPNQTLRKSLTVAAQASAGIEFPVGFQEAGRSQWTWRARFKDDARQYADAVQSVLTVNYPQPLLREVLFSRVDSPETNLLANANPRLLEGRGQATVRIANTRLCDVGEAADHLLHYPYGCVEQTSSSLLPWLVLQDLPAGAEILKRSNLDRTRALRIGLNRLLSMQTSSGGLAYWPGDPEAMVWASAYGGLCLALLERNGCDVPDDRMQSLARYLSAALRDVDSFRDQYDLSAYCLGLLTLAIMDAAEPAYHERFFEQRAKLNSENCALLALAILESKGPQAMALELLKQNQPKLNEELAWFGCVSREKAIRLMAWCRCQPDSPEVDRRVEELLGHQSFGHWITTQGNAWSLWALADYARLVERTLQDAKGVVLLGDQERPFHLEAKPSLVETVFELVPGANEPIIRLRNPDSRRLYARVRVETRPASPHVATEDKGFALRRTYSLLDDDNQAHEISQVKVGDRILITLNLQAHKPAHYVAIDDPLPGLFEPIHAKFISQQVAADAESDFYADYKETRKDRVLHFRDHLWPGTYTIQYLARVRASGNVIAPSAKIEEMYQPARFGLSGSQTISARMAVD